jgi:Ca2+-binding RTX toxin-like protein
LRIEIWSDTYGTPTFSNLSLSNLDGGAGVDTLSFMESHTDGAELTLTTGGATNFENLEGTLYRTTGAGDTMRGDSTGNTLRGLTGSDTIHGGSGDDVLYGDKVVSLDLNAYGISRIYEASDSPSEPDDDNLYGEAGNDILVGTAGNNILDGGTGADTIVTGDGVDTIILRSGDGGTSVDLADTITDFEDGVDVIGLDDGLQYSDLIIAQSGSDTVISAGSEYLAVLTDISVENVNYLDFVSMAEGSQTLTGSDQNDVFLGASGVDTITTGNG